MTEGIRYTGSRKSVLPKMKIGRYLLSYRKRLCENENHLGQFDDAVSKAKEVVFDARIEDDAHYNSYKEKVKSSL